MRRRLRPLRAVAGGAAGREASRAPRPRAAARRGGGSPAGRSGDRRARRHAGGEPNAQGDDRAAGARHRRPRLAQLRRGPGPPQVAAVRPRAQFQDIGFGEPAALATCPTPRTAVTDRPCRRLERRLAHIVGALPPLRDRRMTRLSQTYKLCFRRQRDCLGLQMRHRVVCRSATADPIGGWPMSRKHMLLRGAMMTGSLLFLAYPAAAQSNQQLQDEIRQLQQQLQNLQNQVNQQPTAPAAAPVAGGPRVTLSPNNRPGVASADGQNTIELTSRLHFDIADYLKVEPQSPTGPHSLTSGVNARRARLGVLGKFMGDWNYTLIFDFSGSSDSDLATVTGSRSTDIENAYISYTGFRPVAIDFGYLDVPFTLDEA